MLLATIAAVAFIAYALYNVKNLLVSPKVNFLTVRVDKKKILFVSDLHIPKSLKTGKKYCVIGEYMEKNNIRLLFILGDLFDDFHVEVSSNQLKVKLREIIKILKLPPHTFVYITFSSSSHDPKIKREGAKVKQGSVEIIATNNPIRLIADNREFYLLHGDLGVKNGALAYLLNKAACFLGYPYFVERSLKKSLRLKEKSWLIMGHTHAPFIDDNFKLANTGSWKHYWRSSSDNVILYDSGSLSLINLGGGINK